jgi:hypothetical protein
VAKREILMSADSKKPRVAGARVSLADQPARPLRSHRVDRRDLRMPNDTH